MQATITTVLEVVDYLTSLGFRVEHFPQDDEFNEVWQGESGDVFTGTSFMLVEYSNFGGKGFDLSFTVGDITKLEQPYRRQCELNGWPSMDFSYKAYSAGYLDWLKEDEATIKAWLQ